MNDNCPVDCELCRRESIEIANDRAEARQMKEEDDANFSDQDFRDDGQNYNLDSE